jgi:hypothetical protein
MYGMAELTCSKEMILAARGSVLGVMQVTPNSRTSERVIAHSKAGNMISCVIEWIVVNCKAEMPGLLTFRLDLHLGTVLSWRSCALRNILQFTANRDVAEIIRL